MHVVTLLKSDMFDLEIEGRPASIAEVLPDWNPHDRFGLVIDDPLGGIGATHLLQIAITSFYDIKPSRRTDLTVYPEIYAFHIGKGYGAHAPYDFWPARREIITSLDHREVLDAINDRGITRLAVPDRAPHEVAERSMPRSTASSRLLSTAPRAGFRIPTWSFQATTSEPNSTPTARCGRATPTAGRPRSRRRPSRSRRSTRPFRTGSASVSTI
ncbi:hypothetical protein MLTONO_p0372 (plasmid) [Mesorhizobium loti]|nr:hypothetical protein MLTONO_p0372 [Mesorhizobium loti]